MAKGQLETLLYRQYIVFPLLFTYTHVAVTMTTTWYALGTILTTTYHILQPAERKSDGLCSFLNVSRDDEWWIIDLILRFLSSSLLAHLIWNQPLHNLIVRDSIEDNSIHPLHQHYLISLFDSVANLRFLFLYQLPGLILLRLLSTSSQSVSQPSQPASQPEHLQHSSFSAQEPWQHARRILLLHER